MVSGLPGAPNTSSNSSSVAAVAAAAAAAAVVLPPGAPPAVAAAAALAHQQAQNSNCFSNNSSKHSKPNFNKSNRLNKLKLLLLDRLTLFKITNSKFLILTLFTMFHNKRGFLSVRSPIWILFLWIRFLTAKRLL